MKTYLINGLSIGAKTSITGVQRACRELIYGLDKIIGNESDIVVKYLFNSEDRNIVVNPSELKNIELVSVKPDKRKLWKYRIVKEIVKKENATLICMSLETFFVKKQISFIYDIRAATMRFDTFRFRLKYMMYLWLQKKNTKLIITDSNYQRRQIIDYLDIDPSRVATLYMGYEHILSIKADYSILNKYPILMEHPFYYILGSLAPHKNLKWVIEVAKRNKSKVFAIAGGKDLTVWKDNIEVKGIDNLLFLGYITDEQSKALMEKCTAFIHPSKYEGFGISPLEALACGTKVFLSNATCLPEIYEDCVTYFDPDDYEVNLNEMQVQQVGCPEKVFNKCSWKKSSNSFKQLLLGL